MRIGTNAFYRAATATVNRLQRELGNLTAAMSSGKRISKPSDDPLAATTVARTHTAIAAATARGSILDAGIRMCREADGAVAQISNALARAVEVAARALQPGGMVETTRHAAAAEVRSLSQTILSAANSKSGERYLFSGYQDRTAPFQESGGGVTYEGDSNQPGVPLGAGRVCPMTVAGVALLNFEDAAGQRAVDGVGDVFAVLEALATAIEDGEATTMGQRLDDVRALYGHVTQLRGSIGSWEVRLQSNRDALEADLLRFHEVLASAESMDIAEGITEYAGRETSYQATLSVLARIVAMPTMFDLIR